MFGNELYQPRRQPFSAVDIVLCIYIRVSTQILDCPDTYSIARHHPEDGATDSSHPHHSPGVTVVD